ncbi:MAG: hypothetical protein CMB80_32865 [Flammeovirgaceae bacterium]|nr:hypothetical protein [Flammeovirgaceae bacterium]MBR10616.1 hypothetical protein [Rickettsiales bacterium]HCX21175.1 hypothetical protein [Cytophagales bacterium]
MLEYTDELKLSEEGLFDDLVRNTSNAVIIADLDGSIVFCNAGFTKITGYTLEEVQGKKPGTFLQGPKTDPVTIQRISNKLHKFERVNESILNYHKDGSTYWLQLDIYPILDKNNEPSHFMAIESVITELKETEQLAEERQERIEENISYAKKLQQALFRKDSLEQEIFTDRFVLDQPKDEVGGDFYIIDQIQNKKIVFVGDCTGHGASGAILTALCTSTVKSYLTKYKTLSPALIIEKSRQKVEELLQGGELESVPDNMEATLLFIDESRQEIKYASTTQEIYYIGEEDNLKIKPEKVKVDGRYEVQDKTLKYKPGSMIYAASDGFKDQFGEASGKKFSSKQLHETLSLLFEAPCSEQEQKLTNTFIKWRGSESQTDDVLILGIRL